MAEKTEETGNASPNSRNPCDACPHCGHELSPWQQVLLRIDRALVCRNCWYRIILDVSEKEEPTERKD